MSVEICFVVVLWATWDVLIRNNSMCSPSVTTSLLINVILDNQWKVISSFACVRAYSPTEILATDD